jgi:hypothetical protein
MVLATSTNNKLKSFKLLCLCSLVIIIPTVISAKLMNNHNSTSYFITIFVSCTLLISSMITSMVTFFILKADSLELFNTDNLIYYLKMLNCLIIILGFVISFLNGIYILFFESFGIFRLINVANEGLFAAKLAFNNWNEYKLRTLAVSKVTNLTEFNIQSFTSMKTQNSNSNELANIQSEFENMQNEA